MHELNGPAFRALLKGSAQRYTHPVDRMLPARRAAIDIDARRRPRLGHTRDYNVTKACAKRQGPPPRAPAVCIIKTLKPQTGWVARLGNLQHFGCPPVEAYLPALARLGNLQHFGCPLFEAWLPASVIYSTLVARPLRHTCPPLPAPVI